MMSLWNFHIYYFHMMRQESKMNHVTNLDYVLKNINITKYHVLLLERYDEEVLCKEYANNTYRLSNAVTWGGVVTTNGVKDFTTMFEFEKWLVHRFDRDHVLLKQALLAEHLDELEILDMNIVQYTNTLTELHTWLLRNTPGSIERIDFSGCNIPLVIDAFETLSNIDRNKLLLRLDELSNYMVLHRYYEGITVDCQLLRNNQLSFIDNVYNIYLSPIDNAYKKAGHESESVINFVIPSSTNEHLMLRPLRVHDIKVMMRLFAAIKLLRAKTYLI